MDIIKKIEGTTLTVALTERLDTVTSPQLEGELRTAMNGVTENTKVNYVLTWWQKAIIAAEVVTGVLACGFVVLDVLDEKKNHKKG